MIKSKISALWGKKIPSVYYFFYDEYVYIGITEDFPFQRWSNHFNKDGSFIKAIKRFIPEFDYNVSDVKVVSVTLDKEYIRNTKMLQALEKELHSEFDRNPFVGDKGYSVISSTLKTAPRKFNYDDVKLGAHVIRNEVNQLFKLAL